MKPFFPWVGGKRALMHEILPRIPKDNKKYIEVFGGSGAVLFAKQETSYEIYNDFNSDLVNLFLVVKERPMAFMSELCLLPTNSRDEFQYLKRILNGSSKQYNFIEEELKIAELSLTEDEFKEIEKILKTKAELNNVNRAVAFYKIQKLSYGARGSSFGGTPVAISIRKIYLEIKRAHHRLRRVVIENLSFEKLIPRHAEDPEAFYYCDPPYFNTEGHYDAEFTPEQHVILRDQLASIKGKFLLSYNDCEYIRELYKDFYIVPVTRMNNLKQRYEPGSEFKELLIANYDITHKQYNYPKQLSIWEE